MQWMPLLNGSHQRAFLDLARKAHAMHPDLLSVHVTLGGLLLSTREYEEAIRVLSNTINAFPSEPKPFLMLADAYHRTSQSALAFDILKRVPASYANDPNSTLDYLTLKLRTLKRLKALDDAVEVAVDLLGMDPINDYALRLLASFARTKGDLKPLLGTLYAALAHQPGHTTAQYELATTLALLKRADEAKEALHLDRHIKITDLDPPLGYQNALAFETALASEIISDETLEPDPRGKATEGGFQTEGFLPHDDKQSSLRELVSVIQTQVQCFVANLAGPPDDPFIKRRPKQARLNAWAVVYPGNGRQAPHIHPDGWLSGVYYVSVPKGHGLQAGCLRLGSLDEELRINPPWGTLEITPAPGRLVLFPSYIPHSTIPTGSDQNRICIAFDVVPHSE